MAKKRQTKLKEPKKNKNKKILNKKRKKSENQKIENKKIKINEEKNTCETIDLKINMKLKKQNYTYVKTLIEGKMFCYISFKSLNDRIYIIYKIYDNNIIYIYDFNNEQISFTINEPNFCGLRHILDKKNKRDLIMTISKQKIKIWNFNNMKCITEINKTYQICNISYLNNDEIYIIESTDELPILVYNIEGKIIKKIKNSETIYAMEAFYDINSAKSYIIFNNVGYLKSYDFDNDKEYVYYFHDSYNDNFDLLINIKKDETQLIGVGESYPIIIIWNFHSGDKLYDIFLKSSVRNINRISYPFLWDEEHLCFGFREVIGKGICGAYSLKLLNLNNLNICDNLINYEIVLENVQKIKHPIYGDCLITELYDNIGLWKKKNNSKI